MTDTPRETILIELTRRASEGCEGLGDVACFRDLLLMEQWCDPCRCQEAAKIIRWQAAECDTLRAQLADEQAEVARLKALPPGSQCEREGGSGCCCAECCAYCAADLRARLAEAEAQLAAREGEIATLTKEIAKYLTPINENIRRGYLVAAVRDIAQVMFSEQGNAKDAEIKLAAAEARADTAEAQLRAQADEITRLTVERNQQAAEADRYCSQYVDHAKAVIQLRAGLERATAMCRAATTWNAGDLQGLRFHAQEAAREGMAALAAPPITRESQPHE